MPRRSEPDAPQGLNHSYYNPEEPFDINSQESSTSSRRSKPEKSRRTRSPGDDNKSRRSSRRDPSPGHSNMAYSDRRYPPPAAPLPPKGGYDPYYEHHSSRDAPRDSRRGSQRDAPRKSHYRDDDRRPRDYDYPSEPRERRHKSSHREPSGGQFPRSRNASPDPKYGSSRSIPSGDLDRDRHSSHRSRGAPAYASDDERDRRRRSNRSQPREADDSHGRRRDQDRSRDLGQSRDQDRRRDKDRSRDKERRSDRDRAPADGGHLKRRSTMPNVGGSGTRSAKTPLWKNPQVQAIGKSVLMAGAQAYMQNRKEAGSWMGAKGAKVGLTAISAALADQFNKDKKRR